MKKTIIGLLVLAVAILLQIVLSKKEDKKLGLILPIIGVIYSITTLFGISISESTTVGEALGSIVSRFLLGNIPTIILMTIYLGYRGKLKQIKD